MHVHLLHLQRVQQDLGHQRHRPFQGHPAWGGDKGLLDKLVRDLLYC